MQYNTIRSRDNSLIKQVVKLAESRSLREESGFGIVYGAHLVEEAHKYKVLDKIFIHADMVENYSYIFNNFPAEKIYLLEAHLMDKINRLESKVDIIGMIGIPKLSFDDSYYSGDCLLLENIQDPGNLGTILRTAMACGVKNIFLSSGCVDVYNPKVLRSSQGVQLGLNIFMNHDLPAFIKQYKGKVIVTDPDAATSLYAATLSDSPIAWILGNEGSGISHALSLLATYKLKIPMLNTVESLNVAIAGSICLFEMMRQRSG